MGRQAILDAYYTLVTSMTIANGFTYDWASIKTIDNGALTPNSSAPQINFSFGDETNDNEVNGIGNNRLQIVVPLIVTATKLQIAANQTLDAVDYNLQSQKIAMLEDLKRALCNPFKIACSTGFRNVEYNGEVEFDDSNLDEFTSYAVCEFLVTYEQELDLNGW